MLLLNINGSRGAKEWPVAPLGRGRALVRGAGPDGRPARPPPRGRPATLRRRSRRRLAGDERPCRRSARPDHPARTCRGLRPRPRRRLRGCGPLHVAAAVGCPTVAVVGVDADNDGASPGDSGSRASPTCSSRAAPPSASSAPKIASRIATASSRPPLHGRAERGGGHGAVGAGVGDEEGRVTSNE